jgi:hypothetical protein
MLLFEFVSSECHHGTTCQDKPHHVQNRRHSNLGALFYPSTVVLGRKSLAAVFCWPMEPSESGIKNQSLPFLRLVNEVWGTNSSVVTRGMLTVLSQPCLCASTEGVD